MTVKEGQHGRDLDRVLMGLDASRRTAWAKFYSLKKQCDEMVSADWVQAWLREAWGTIEFDHDFDRFTHLCLILDAFICENSRVDESDATSTRFSSDLQEFALNVPQPRCRPVNERWATDSITGPMRELIVHCLASMSNEQALETLQAAAGLRASAGTT